MWGTVVVRPAKGGTQMFELPDRRLAAVVGFGCTQTSRFWLRSVALQPKSGGLCGCSGCFGCSSRSACSVFPGQRVASSRLCLFGARKPSDFGLLVLRLAKTRGFAWVGAESEGGTHRSRHGGAVSRSPGVDVIDDIETTENDKRARVPLKRPGSCGILL